MVRAAAPFLVLALILAGCTSPEAPAPTPSVEPSASPTAVPTPTPANATPSPTPTPADATPTPATPTPSPTPPAAPRLQPPCWETKRGNVVEPRGDAGTVEADGSVRRADLAAVEVGIGNARAYLLTCAGGDLSNADLGDLRVEVVNGTGLPPAGGVRDGAPFVSIDVAYPPWSGRTTSWSAGVEQTRLAARAYAEAWLAAAGCDAGELPTWLARGSVEHAAFGASALAGDLSGESFGAVVWRDAESVGGFDRSLASIEDPRTGFFAFHLLIGHADDGAAALPRLCAAMAGGAPFDQALAGAFGVAEEDLAAEWDAFRVMPPPFSARAGLTMPPAPPQPECFGEAAGLASDPFPVDVHPDAVGPVAEDVRLGLQRGWGFLRACLGAEEPTGWTGVVVRIVADPALTRYGNGWEFDGGAGYVNVTIDVSNRMWAEGPREFGLDAWRRVNGAYMMASVWYDSHDCRVRDAPTPYWLDEGLRQYVARGQAVATADIDAGEMRQVAWSNAMGSGAAGAPLSNWTERRQDSWPGDWVTFAMERLVAESDEGPASIAALCGSLKEGTSANTAFALAFGQRMSAVADDPTWPAMPAEP